MHSRQAVQAQDTEDFSESPTEEATEATGAHTTPQNKSKRSGKRTRRNQPRTEAPPSKRAKTQRNAPASQHACSRACRKYINSDLPQGDTTNNLWRRVFISILAHFAAGYQDPWVIPDDQFISTLQVIWNSVYKNIKHSVVLNGSVYYVGKQNLANWRGGFAAAAIAVITAFFASFPDFTEPEPRVQFAQALLKNHRFLFSENADLDKKNWSGLSSAPFILQTFVHHFNFIQGGVEIAKLDKGAASPRTALALTCTTVRRTLTLIVNNNITFKGMESGDGLFATVHKGSQYEFNESIWGSTTCRFLRPIMQLSDDRFALIVDDTQLYVKKGETPTSSLHSGGEDEEFDSNLFEFR